MYAQYGDLWKDSSLLMSDIFNYYIPYVDNAIESLSFNLLIDLAAPISYCLTIGPIATIEHHLVGSWQWATMPSPCGFAQSAICLVSLSVNFTRPNCV